MATLTSRSRHQPSRIGGDGGAVLNDACKRASLNGTLLMRSKVSTEHQHQLSLSFHSRAGGHHSHTKYRDCSEKDGCHRLGNFSWHQEILPILPGLNCALTGDGPRFSFHCHRFVKSTILFRVHKMTVLCTPSRGQFDIQRRPCG